MTEVSNEVKIPIAEPNSKGILAKGKGVTEAVIKERKPVILSETPGRDISIKPRSPYREFKGEHWNRSSSDRSSEDSVRVNDSKIRSVYEIRGSNDRHYGSPNHSTPPNYNPHIFSSAVQPPTVNPQIPPGAIPIPYYYPHPAFPQYQAPQQVALAPNAMPDYDSYSDELEKQARLHFKSLFSALKIKYQDEDFSEYDPDMPLRFIHQTYLDYKRNLAIKSNAFIVKIVMVFIFFGIDFICRKFMGFDSSSFTESQLARMKSYDGIINEISAAFVGSGDNDWPVGVRFAFLLSFNSGLWIGVSYICAKFGYKNPQGIINMVNGVIGNSVDEVVQAKPPSPVDPITNTTDVTKTDPLKNLMGNANTLLAMAGSALGTKPKNNADLGDAIGTLGANFLANNVKSEKKTFKFGTRKQNK